MTVLSRSQKSDAYDPSVKVIQVDYNSKESLTSALQGQDAVVSTLGWAATDGQKILIDAAIAAGVKHFIPSEFGSCTTNPELRNVPMYSGIANVREYLIEKSRTGALSYSVLACGAFLEFYLNSPSLIDIANRKAVLIDGGDNRMSTTSLESVGKAIAGILKHPNETKNRTVYVSQAILTQNKVLNIAKEIRPDIKWDISRVESNPMFQEALAAFAAGDYSAGTVLKLVTSTAGAGDRYGAAFDKTDNQLLGIEALSEDELKEIIAEKFK